MTRADAPTAALLFAAVVIPACGDLPWSEEGTTTETSPASVTACGGEVEELPDDLACTGLYDDFAAKRVASRVRAYAPAVALWSDGLDKDRYVDLPDGATIDASRPDDWTFPVGTKTWKEIRKGARKIETRYFVKVRDDRWLQAAYVWSADGTTARRGEGAKIDLDGRDYVVPTTNQCSECHRGRRDRVLGFEALSLGQPGASGLTLAALAAEGRLAPPPSETTLSLPDDGTGKAAAALGYLHVNCGVTCHNETPGATGFSTGLRLRVSIRELDEPPSAFEALTTTLGVPARTPRWEGEARIAPGDPEASLLVSVMKQRGEGQMPPLATDVVDDRGVGAVADWIRAMPRRALLETEAR